MILTKSDILESNDFPHEDVEVPEWGGTVRVRSMSGAERDALEAHFINAGVDKLTNLRARLCALCIVDDKMERLFNDDDIAALGKKSAKALDRVADVAQRLNGMGAKAEDAAIKK